MPHETEPSVGVGRRRVLIVEDDTRLREMLVRAVGEMEFESESASTAEAAIGILEGVEFDIVVADLRLPGMDGLEMCRVIRERWPQVQLVVLTGHGDLDAAKSAIRMDVVDFLTKPCPLRDLETALDRALRRRRNHIVVHAVGGEDEAPVKSDVPQSLQDVEREHILAALARHDGNRSATADELGISVRTLYYRLSEYEHQGHFTRQ